MSANAWRSMLVLSLVGLIMWACIGKLAFGDIPRSVQVPVHFDSPANVESLCRLISSGRLRNVEGCANTALIIAPDPCLYRGRYAEIMCHEITCHVVTGRGDHAAPGCRA